MAGLPQISKKAFGLRVSHRNEKLGSKDDIPTGPPSSVAASGTTDASLREGVTEGAVSRTPDGVRLPLLSFKWSDVKFEATHKVFDNAAALH